MNDSFKEDVENFKECLQTHGPRTTQNLLAALLVWLFGTLVFTPLADTLNWQTRTLTSLLFFITFTILVVKAVPGLKKLIDVFSTFPARKYGTKKGLSYEDSTVLFRHIFYIIAGVILYLLYSPLLISFHAAVNGIVLILVLIWIFLLTSRILTILSQKILEWLVKK